MNAQYQPSKIRTPIKTDYITRGTVAAQTCSQEKNANTTLDLTPIGPDRAIGGYVPKNLIPLNNHIDARGTSTCLTEDTANALISMFEDMEKQGMKPIMTSGFRTRGVQESIYKKELEAQKKKPTPYPSVAQPEHSEHQLGTTFDMKSGTTDETSYEKFVSSKEYAWMKENAYTYGFIQSYQEGTEKITGYIPEPWHWRYVGTENAQKIHDQQITTYEYLKNIEKTIKEKTKI
jgi:LAS superfamily LD-carboxypeptidase LdcB